MSFRLFILGPSSSMLRAPLSVCIVGGGPAGFYTAHQLLKLSPTARVTIIERLPTPYGLVRYGVAPDHQDVKNVTETFDLVGANPNFTFAGNVEVPRDITVSRLRSLFSAVVISTGAESDQLLNIPGEDTTRNVFGAREFVGWYNGEPRYADLAPQLHHVETVCIAGMGNVALDCARMLLRPPVPQHHIADMPSYALQTLLSSGVKRVIMLGRRGPLDVAFTTKELREMTKLEILDPPQKIGTLIAPEDMEFSVEENQYVNNLPRPKKRLLELLKSTAARHDEDLLTSQKSWSLLFRRSPVAINADPISKQCVSVRTCVNELIGPVAARQAQATNQFKTVDCQMFIRSIGYKSCALEGLPFDVKRNRIPTAEDRVVSADGQPITGVYSSGWIKTGPVGVILSTMQDAFSTANTILKDYEDGKLLTPPNQQLPLSSERVLNFEDWLKIDRFEKINSKDQKMTRVKLTKINEMLAVAGKLV